MEPTRLRCMVVVPDGASRRVGPSGLLIGRQRDCDIVATDPTVSRRHALVRLTGEGAEVVPLGKAPIVVNGKETDMPRPLADGDELGIPGLALKISIDVPRPSRGAPAGFVLERAGGAGSFGITHSPFVMGGGDTDDLIVKKWPARSVVFHLAQGELYVELVIGSATRNGAEIEPQTFEPLAVGDVLTCNGEQFSIAHAGGHVATTAVRSTGELPSRVSIEMLPRGGRIVFTITGREFPVYLADRRFDFMFALLRPAHEHKPGEFIDDDTIRTIVWPRKPAVSRPEINMLISRIRRDLVEAGLAGPRLIERAPGGGGTRLQLAAGAHIEVLS